MLSQPASCAVALGVAVLVGCSAGGSATPSSRAQPGTSAGSSANGGDGPLIVTGSGGDSNIDVTLGQRDGGTVVADGCGTTLDVTYRDFNEMHPDFEMPFSGDVVRRGLLQDALAADHTPVFKEGIGHPALSGSPTGINTDWTPTGLSIHSADTFAEWYHTTQGINIELKKKLALTETAPGSGLFGYESSAFFPLAPTEGFGITPKDNDLHMNFLFTTEIHVQFGYTLGQKFTFRGDDDLWIFVNGKLALDLGSMHDPEEGTIDFDAQAASLGIAPGNSYPMDIFHAERHTRGSNFKVTTNISCFTPSEVVK